jgi:hypothetical protein
MPRFFVELSKYAFVDADVDLDNDPADEIYRVVVNEAKKLNPRAWKPSEDGYRVFDEDGDEI